MIGNRLGVFGVATFVVLVASFLVFAYVTPGYSHAANMVSELGTSSAPYALGWNLVGFGLAGLLVYFLWLLALGVSTARRPSKV